MRRTERVIRRGLGVLLLAAVTAAAWSLPGRPRASAAAPARPNILIIVTDDQRVGTMAVMPSTRRLFEHNGTSFTQTFATTPLCCPSRASIFTGRYAHNHGVRNNREGANLDQRSTIQRYLSEAGYRTAIMGKYLNSLPIEMNPPYFDSWATFPSSGSTYVGGKWNVDGTVRTIDRYSTDFILDRAQRFLRESESDDSRPWFMYLSPPAPHIPYIPEPDYAVAHVPRWHPDPGVLEEDRSDKPAFVQALNVSLWRMRAVRRQQLRTLMSVDDLVDDLFESLSNLGERRPTLAFFMSDNGYMWGDHGLGGTKFAKRPPYTNSVKIPLIVRWPRHVARGVEDDRLAANIDIAPTIVRAARLTTDGSYPMDGRSLLSARTRRRLLLEYWIDAGTTPDWAATRTDGYEFVEYYLNDGLTPTFREYYDLGADPWQLSNLFAGVSSIGDPRIATLHRRLAHDRSCSGPSCP
jgi:arylsulfatase A-like enzyme